jgi:hypothetical protein
LAPSLFVPTKLDKSTHDIRTFSQIVNLSYGTNDRVGKVVHHHFVLLGNSLSFSNAKSLFVLPKLIIHAVTRALLEFVECMDKGDQVAPRGTAADVDWWLTTRKKLISVEAKGHIHKTSKIIL